MEGVEGNAVVLDQPEHGLARQVLVPAYLAERLAGDRGRTVTLHTMEYLEAQGQGSSFIPRIVGFGTWRVRSVAEGRMEEFVPANQR